MDSFYSLWEKVKGECQNNISETIFDVWFKDLDFIDYDSNRNTAILHADVFKARIIEKKFMNIIKC